MGERDTEPAGWLPTQGHFAGRPVAQCGCGNPAEQDLRGRPRPCRTCRTRLELAAERWAGVTLHRCPGCGQWGAAACCAARRTA